MSYSLLSVELCSSLIFTEATTKKKGEGNSKHLYKCLKAKVEANQLGKRSWPGILLPTKLRTTILNSKRKT